MPLAARVGDQARCPSCSHGCPGCGHEGIGEAKVGSPDAFINNKPIVRVGDAGVHSSATCCGANEWEALKGSPSVFINGKPVMRVGDKTKHCGGDGEIIEGSPNVTIGNHSGAPKPDGKFTKQFAFFSLEGTGLAGAKVNVYDATSRAPLSSQTLSESGTTPLEVVDAPQNYIATVGYDAWTSQFEDLDDGDDDFPLDTSASDEHQSEVAGPVCAGAYCIKKGDRSELIREINVRLCGFGGNVPTDTFTDRTEAMVKQFQRDYMKVDETGKVCGDVLRAIDEFANIYTPPSISSARCPCGKCGGFGKQRFSEQRQSAKVAESARKYEYPGIHRQLFWALRAVKFYLAVAEKDLGYSIRSISSGYRCHDDNATNGRTSTNHMGKALDLHFNKNGARTRAVADIEEIRSKVFNKYLGAQFSWPGADVFSLETSAQGATTWVHVDVRAYSLTHLDDRYFAKTMADVDGTSISALARESNPNTCACGLALAANV